MFDFHRPRCESQKILLRVPLLNANFGKFFQENAKSQAIII